MNEWCRFFQVRGPFERLIMNERHRTIQFCSSTRGRLLGSHYSFMNTQQTFFSWNRLIFFERTKWSDVCGGGGHSLTRLAVGFELTLMGQHDSEIDIGAVSLRNRSLMAQSCWEIKTPKHTVNATMHEIKDGNWGARAQIARKTFVWSKKSLEKSNNSLMNAS